MGIFSKIFAKIMGRGKPRESRESTQDFIARISDKSEQELLAKIKSESSRQKDNSIDALKAKIAAGSRKVLAGMETIFRNERESSESERQRREETRAREPWYRFIYIGIPLTDFRSSNVSWVQYDRENASLYIAYIKNGCTYRYFPVTEREAISIFNSQSKGIWVWDNLRIRGTKLGHRKNYMLVNASTDGPWPKWTQSTEDIDIHDEQVGGESGESNPHRVLGIGETGGLPAIYGANSSGQPYRALGRFARTAPKGN